MKDLSEFLIDPKKKNEGVPFELGPCTFMITRLGTDAAQKEMLKARKKIFGVGKLGEQAYQNNEDSTKTKLMMQFVVASVIKGWEGFILNGEEVPYSPQKALEIIQDEQFEPIYEFVIECASQEADFKQSAYEEDAEDMGN